MTIKQWRDFIKHHEKFTQIFPELKNHSIISSLHWQVDIAQELIDEVRD